MILPAPIGELRLPGRLAARMICAAGATALLAAVTAMYLEPGFVVTLANQLWICF